MVIMLTITLTMVIMLTVTLIMVIMLTITMIMIMLTITLIMMMPFDYKLFFDSDNVMTSSGNKYGERPELEQLLRQHIQPDTGSNATVGKHIDNVILLW